MFAYSTPSSIIGWTKFEDLIIANGRTYVNATTINNIYRKTNRKANSTQMKLINDLQIETYLKVKHTPKHQCQENSFRMRFLGKFKLQSRTIYLPIDELVTLKEGVNKQNHMELLRLIKLLPDIASESGSGEQEESIDDYHNDSFLSIDTYIEMTD